MALDAILRKFETTSGLKVEGSNTQKGREKDILVIAFESEVKAPRDVVTGFSTGKRNYMPPTVTQEYDCNTPDMYTILAQNMTIKELKFSFFSPRTIGVKGGGGGTEVESLIITAKNCHLADVRLRQFNTKNIELQKLETQLQWSFVFEEITIDWVNNTKKTFQDSWHAGAALG